MSAYQEIEDLRATIDNLSKRLTNMKEQRDLHKKRYEQLDARSRRAEQTIDDLLQELELRVYGSTDLTTPNVIDLSGCQTLIERLERIAVANRGELNIPAAREIIYAAGASKAKGHHLGSDILKALKRNAQDWEQVEERTYRYRPCDEKGDEGP